MTKIQRTTYCLISIAALCFANSCYETPPRNAADSESAPSLTWSEYSARAERERDFSDDRFMRPRLPDMSRWEPRDFLSSDQLAANQIDFCDLETAERMAYAQVSNVAFNDLPREESLDRLLTWAGRGLIQAKAELYNFCGDTDFLEAQGVEHAEVVRRVREAAASGNAFAMRSLGHCLYRFVRRGRITRADLAVDEMLYWYSRAAAHLDTDALNSLWLFVGREIYGYPTAEENLFERYLWTRLLDLAWIYSGESDELRKEFSDIEEFRRENGMTSSDVEVAEERVAAWLEAHPTAFAEFRLPLGCPDMTWRDGEGAAFRDAELLRVLGRDELPGVASVQEN